MLKDHKSLELKTKDKSQQQYVLEKSITEELKPKGNGHQRFEFLAPFDMFGVSPKFYLDGRNKTLTWIGCVCSVVLVGTIMLLLIVQLISHSNKIESLVTSYETEMDGFDLYDLHAGEHIFAI